MSCKEYSEYIGDYVNRTLDSGKSARVHAHVDSCVKCARLVRELQSTARMVASLDRTSAPEGFESRLAARLAAQKTIASEHPIRAWFRSIFATPAYGYRVALRPALAGAVVCIIAAGSMLMTSHNTPVDNSQVDWGYMQTVRSQHSSFAATNPLGDDSAAMLKERSQDMGADF